MDQTKYPDDNEEAAIRHNQLQTLRTHPISDEAASTTWEKAGGAKRSSPMLPWFMKPLRAIRGSLRRFEIGLKYGYQNWKGALGTSRENWHDGEPGPGHPKDESALGFVRQFVAHAEEHYYWITELVDRPHGETSKKGDTLTDNVDAWVWNVLCAAEYFHENPDMFREAFSKWPVGSPLHRLDRVEPVGGRPEPGTPGEAEQGKGVASYINLDKRAIEPNKQPGPIPTPDPALDRILLKHSLNKFMNTTKSSRCMVGDFEIIRVR